MSLLVQKIREYLALHHQRHLFRRAAAVLGCIVVFVTTYALIYPAITLEKHAVCGIEEHTHTDACYEEKLICGLEEPGGTPEAGEGADGTREGRGAGRRGSPGRGGSLDDRTIFGN